MKIFLNSFAPLCITPQGITAAATYSLPLFIDGSCRREPDFQNPNPAITQLCRPLKLVPRLSIGDLVIYITKLGRYGTKLPHWKFIGILEVIDIQPDHNTASLFYTSKSLPISQNLMCPLTIPFPFNMTHGLCGFKPNGLSHSRIITLWNNGYQGRANDYPQVAITRTWEKQLFLVNPPIITREMMVRIFKRIPVTQNPPYVTDEEWAKFKHEMKI